MSKLRRNVFSSLFIFFALCFLVDFAAAAELTGYYTTPQNSSNMTITNCPPGQSLTSSTVTFNVNDSNIPANAVVVSVEVVSGGVTYSGQGAITSTQAKIKNQQMSTFATLSWGSGNKTTFTAMNLGSSTLLVKGSWQIQYVGQNITSALGPATKSHTQLTLKFVYRYTQ